MTKHSTIQRFASENEADSYMRRRNACAVSQNRFNDLTVIVADENGDETVAMSIREAIANDFLYRWAT